MKKQILSLLIPLILSINTIFGQFKLDATGANDMRLRTNNIDRVNILTNGNVGIGTPTPNAKLNLIGDLSIGNKLTYTTLGVQNALNRNGSSRIYFSASGAIMLNGITGGVDGLMIFLYTAAGVTLTINNENGLAVFGDRIATHTGGNIINGRGGVTMIYDSSVSTWRIIGFADENTSWFLTGNSGTNPANNFIGTTDAQPLKIRTNNTVRMTVEANGNVGIGATTPTAKLDIDGDIVVKKITVPTTGAINALNRLSASSIYFNGIAPTLNGIAGGVDGMILYVFTSSGSTLVLANESISASVGTRIATHTGANVTISGRGGATLIYESSTALWRVVGVAN